MASLVGIIDGLQGPQGELDAPREIKNSRMVLIVGHYTEPYTE